MLVCSGQQNLLGLRIARGSFFIELLLTMMGAKDVVRALTPLVDGLSLMMVVLRQYLVPVGS